MKYRHFKRKIKTFISCFMSLVFVVSALLSTGAFAASSSENNQSVKIVTDGNSWTGGFTLNITVQNIGNKVIDNWKIKFSGNDVSIDSIWCADYKIVDDMIEITPISWGQSIPVSSDTTFGFIATGDMPKESDFVVVYYIGGNEYVMGDNDINPTKTPTETPTVRPTVKPTEKPTVRPTVKPTEKPTVRPTVRPTVKPTVKPTEKPTVKPTEKPTVKPTEKPTVKPTVKPTEKPTVKPTETPTIKPTQKPTQIPTTTPSYEPSSGVAKDGDDWLHVEGTNICDKYGNKVWLTGANWFGFNCRERMLLDSYHSNIVKDIEEVANKGINVVRMPIATDLLYAWSQGSYPPSTDTSYNNTDLAGLNSFELFNFMLENFKRVGIKVILDVHGAQTDNQGHTHPVWYKGTITESVFKKAWVWTANYYKNNDTIIGFDLKNEPHTNTGDVKIKSESAIWDDSNHANNWKRVAQETALAILEVHPHALIFVEGVEIYQKDSKWDDEEVNLSPWGGRNDYYSTWWGGNLRGVADYPIDLGKYQSQLVYSPHDYGPIVYEQNWFKGDFVTASDKEAYDILYNECWRDNWGYIIEDGIAPLLIGEWGGITEGNHKLLEENKKYLRCMRDYILKNKYSMHHTFWCINIDSADTNGLLTRDEGTPFDGGRDLKWNDYKYDNFVKPVLWQTDDGRFIGLDHEVPLGNNGIALGTTQY